ncbi:MAG: Asp-tRNA(Asn)/Glu-tRNA(Gln) amidotransferase subunit GatB [Actinomycetota bacterium]
MSTDLETVIGLECHVELDTDTKMFCGCRNEFGGEPNTNVCPICLGHPGTLPVPNEKAIDYIIRIGLALGCEIAPNSLFHRKNYFYPDMPKNFQISQYDLPICVNGHLGIEAEGELRTIGITRVHMEEDTGKTAHASVTGRIHDAAYALVDYNRAGVPLVEVVSEPDMRSAEEARAYLNELRAALESLGVSDVRMEEGSLRCDANISVRPRGESELGVKVEIKNLNSVRSLFYALKFEEERQRKAVEAGEPLRQETRHWDEDSGVTSPLRSKEYAFDYRYFPEPDLPPLEPEGARIDLIRADLPEMPAVRRARFEKKLGVKPEAARVLMATREWADFFEEAVKLGAEPSAAANWLTQDVAGHLRETNKKLSRTDLTPQHLADVVKSVNEGVLSTAGAKRVIHDLVSSTTAKPLTVASKASIPSVAVIIQRQGLTQRSDREDLSALVDEVIAENPEPVEQFKAGKEGVLGFLVGQAMKKTGGSANPKVAGDLLRERLSGG